MGASSSKSTLYRTIRRFVIWAALASILAQVAPTQTARGARKNKGPRALGLIELMPNGKARLIPIAILYDGQFYDAGAYKASPVPMALWAETVYEGVRTGVSQGLFTVTTALENQKTNEWIAEGTWQSAGSLTAKSAMKPQSSEPRGLNDDAGPPVLRHVSAEKPKPPEAAPPQTTPQPPPPAVAAAPQPAPPAPTPAASSSAPEPEDKDRPVLQRGKPAPKPQEPFSTPATNSSKAAANPPAPAAPMKAASQPQLIPAISDANISDPQPYTYDLKPDDEKQLRTKMLELAAIEVRARAKQLASGTDTPPEPAHTSKRQSRASAAKPAQPDFTGVQLRVFDLSNSNEPVLVLTAKASMPQRLNQKEGTGTPPEYLLTLVAREDINGDFHKAFSNVTDTEHLDVLPKYELIDVVDADGDGRGELLFRKVSDAGSAFVVYRVIGDQLYALFEGTPGR